MTLKVLKPALNIPALHRIVRNIRGVLIKHKLHRLAGPMIKPSGLQNTQNLIIGGVNIHSISHLTIEEILQGRLLSLNVPQ